MRLATRFFGLLSVTLLGLTGCYEPGHWGEPGDYRGGYERRGRLERLEGTVAYIDARRQAFSIRTRGDGELIVIYVVPDTPPRARDRFTHLAVGEYVRLETHYVSQDRIELEAFR